MADLASQFTGAAAQNYPTLMNLAMLTKQISQDKRYERPPLSGQAYRDPTVLLKAGRFVRFASAAYMDTEETMCAELEVSEVATICHSHRSDMTACPNFFIATDRLTGAIVLAIRGTASIADALTDCLCKNVPFLEGEAHSGMALSTEKVVEIAEPLLLKLFKQSSHKLFVACGHSLGAGTALLVFITLMKRPSFVAFCKERGIATECFAYAPPPVVRPIEIVPEEIQQGIYSFIYDFDCVPRATVEHGAKLGLALMAIDQLPISKTERLKYLMGGVAEGHLEKRLEDAVDIPPEKIDEYPRMFIPGKLLMLRRENGRACCEVTRRELLDRLLLRPTLVNDHLLGCGYISSLDELARAAALELRGRLVKAEEEIEALKRQQALVEQEKAKASEQAINLELQLQQAQQKSQCCSVQ
eukprot:gnl/TRDRNA2_/TRDRNA2_151034_c0_seq1.p1 gnl/TRDRNA2_/TRDRNA2_151034_c0~~gnl/TRDRNA2_/TRDRNA2_151034_c0_seq1.p1  ORF type:complete len:468 (-),score=87.72 gnl/TRDRNA2_/TRDRNA2_151034_c0_seq1:46-1290(-)